MITPYTLNMSNTSLQLFSISMTVFWILCGCQALVTVHELFDYYKQTKDGKIVLTNLDENLMDDIESQQMRDQQQQKSVNGDADSRSPSTTNLAQLSESQTTTTTADSEKLHKALPIAVPQYDF